MGSSAAKFLELPHGPHHGNVRVLSRSAAGDTKGSPFGAIIVFQKLLNGREPVRAQLVQCAELGRGDVGFHAGNDPVIAQALPGLGPAYPHDPEQSRRYQAAWERRGHTDDKRVQSVAILGARALGWVGGSAAGDGLDTIIGRVWACIAVTAHLIKPKTGRAGRGGSAGSLSQHRSQTFTINRRWASRDERWCGVAHSG